MQIQQEITINAPPARVFDALTADIGAWWGAPYLLNDAWARNIVFEPALGGRVYEDWGNGEGAMWATVTSIKRDDHVELTGRIGMGGAVIGIVAFTLEPRGKATLVRLTHRAAGEISDQQQSGYDKGWQDLVGHRLKAFVETGERLGVRRESRPV